MSNGVTEITEGVITQLEIIESGGNQIEVVNPENNSIEISFSGSSVSADLDITTTTEIITIDNVSDNTTVAITEVSSTSVEISNENTIVEIADKILISGSFDLTFNNLVDSPFTTNDSQNVGTRGITSPDFQLHVSGTLFSDVISSSTFQMNKADGINNIMTVTSQSTTPVMINPAGCITLDNFQYTPSPTAGGLLYSGSEFYLGLE
tara:strand:+ start:406 stop:1026 length:621 start_codon:yes stop_codon:yes gene_type:complete